MVFLFKAIHLVSLSLLAGGIVFFSLTAAPVIFKTFPRRKAGDIVGAIFPRYYFFTYVTGLLAGLSYALLDFRLSVWADAKMTLLVILMILIFFNGLYAGRKAAALKKALGGLDEGKERSSGEKAFKVAHRQAMIVNLAVMILTLTIVLITSAQIHTGGSPW